MSNGRNIIFRRHGSHKPMMIPAPFIEIAHTNHLEHSLARLSEIFFFVV